MRRKLIRKGLVHEHQPCTEIKFEVYPQIVLLFGIDDDPNKYDAFENVNDAMKFINLNFEL